MVCSQFEHKSIESVDAQKQYAVLLYSCASSNLFAEEKRNINRTKNSHKHTSKSENNVNAKLTVI